MYSGPLKPVFDKQEASVSLKHHLCPKYKASLALPRPLQSDVLHDLSEWDVVIWPVAVYHADTDYSLPTFGLGR